MSEENKEEIKLVSEWFENGFAGPAPDRDRIPGDKLELTIGLSEKLLKDQIEEQGFEYVDSEMELHFQTLASSICLLFLANYIPELLGRKFASRLMEQIRLSVKEVGE